MTSQEDIIRLQLEQIAKEYISSSDDHQEMLDQRVHDYLIDTLGDHSDEIGSYLLDYNHYKIQYGPDF